MTEREIFSLIFLAGFSTAQKVTNVSGRGVDPAVV
jgi:chemotaxis protein histidine kinase CheA